MGVFGRSNNSDFINIKIPTQDIRTLQSPHGVLPWVECNYVTTPIRSEVIENAILESERRSKVMSAAKEVLAVTGIENPSLMATA